MSDWQETRKRGACFGKHELLAVFFPDESCTDDERAWCNEQADEICGYCEITDECKAQLRGTRWLRGTWGGIHEQDRRSYR